MQVRRRRLVAEQQSARAAAEARAETDALLDLLAAKSAEESALAARLWQLRREEQAMRKNRVLREAAYAEARERDAREALAREAELSRWARAGAHRGGRVRVWCAGSAPGSLVQSAP